jgi:hypothetical protein
MHGKLTSHSDTHWDVHSLSSIENVKVDRLRRELLMLGFYGAEFEAGVGLEKVVYCLDLRGDG